MTDPDRTEALFYHLEHQPIEDVLPALLEKTRERGWSAVVQSSDETRLDTLDAHLWTYRDDGFLAHGTRKDGHSQWQPIYLTTGDENPNGATVRFLIHGSEPASIEGYGRLVFLFDGRDQTALEAARRHWKRMREAGCEVTYWQQGSGGRWIRKA